MSAENEIAKKVIQFGPFELRMSTGELRKGGTRLKLQGKSFQILQALLERPGEVVTRDELKRRLWPGDTFVDLESGLNTAANRLRLALGDSAEHPRFIETVARSGYRFIAEFVEGAAKVEEPEALPEVPPLAVWARPSRIFWPASALLLGAMLLLMAFWTASHHAPPQPSFRQITYRRGTISNARFASDGQNILYSAIWDGGNKQLFLANTVSPESKELDFKYAKLASVSPSGELALLTTQTAFAASTLSRVPLNGGAPLIIAKGIGDADWVRDSLAAVKISNVESTIEYPLGKVLYRSPGSITDLRISPKGDAFAFLEHPLREDDAGTVKWMDLAGHVKDVSGQWASSGGLAWASSGREIWFTAGQSGVRRTLYATTQAGRVRQVATLPGMLTLYDISKDGRVLLGIDSSRLRIEGRFGSDETERDLSWFDWSHVQDISADGNQLLLDETGDGGGANHSVYLRNGQSDKAIRLGDGEALALSPDGNWTLALNGKSPTSLSLLPIGPNAPRTLAGHGIEYCWARYFPDGQHLLAAGHSPGKPMRLFVQPVSGGEPVALKPEIYLDRAHISPDGKQIVGLTQTRKIAIIPAAGGEARELTIPFPAAPVRWTADGKGLFVRDLRCWIPGRIFRYELASGKLQLWKEMAPADRVGLYYVMNVVMSPDGNSYAYSYMRILSELFVVDGWS